MRMTKNFTDIAFQPMMKQFPRVQVPFSDPFTFLKDSSINTDVAFLNFSSINVAVAV